MRVFITGATGVIGIRAIPLLIAHGHSVTAATRSADKARRVERMGAAATAVDLFDPRSVRRAIAGHDAVVNLATHIPSSVMKTLLPWSWRETDRIRRHGSATLVDAAIAESVSRLVQESFAPIYADGGSAWLDETSPVEPVRYNRTVLDAERSAARFTAAGRVGVVLRFADLYGPDSFLREMLGMVKRGWSPLPGPYDGYVTSVAQDDAATAVVAALALPAGIYNVAEPEPLTRGEWVGSLAEAAGLSRPKPMPRIATLLGGSIMRLLARSERISSVKLRRASPWTPRYRNAAAAWPDVSAQLREQH